MENYAFVDTDEEFSKLLPPKQETLQELYNGTFGAAREYRNEEIEDEAGNVIGGRDMYGVITPDVADSLRDSIMKIEARIFPFPERDARRMIHSATLMTEEADERGLVRTRIYELWRNESEGYHELRDPQNPRLGYYEYDAQRLLRCLVGDTQEAEAA
jgi:hypothetical protein